MKKTTITVIMTVAVMGLTKAQDINALMYKAYLINSMSLWEKAVTVTQAAVQKEPQNAQHKFDLALAQYGLMNATMVDKNEEQFDKYLDPAKENLESLIDDDEFEGESKAILSSILGLQMGYSPWKGMFLGSKSSGLIDEALKKNPESPMVNKLYAGSKLFTPEMFGGDVNVSIEYYGKAIEQYEMDSSMMINNWLYLDAMAFLGLAYKKSGKLNEAIATYKRALEIEPEFGWVENVLLPSAENSKTNK